MTAEKKTSMTFEASMARLEQIVADMEGGALDLDKMIGSFEEGQGLIQFCSKKLDEVERKVEKLVNKGGEQTTVPFEAEEA